MRGTFNRGDNAGTGICRSCKIRFQRANIEPSTGLCCDGIFSCFEISGQENAHYDGVHKAYGEIVSNCPVCHPELDMLLNGGAFKFAQVGAKTKNVDEIAAALSETYKLQGIPARLIATLAYSRKK